MRALKKLTLLAVVTSLICAFAASSASAATATLSITPTGHDNLYYVSISGSVSGSHPRGTNLQIRLWGEDVWYDDLLAGPFSASTFDFSNSFGYQFLISGSTLNEDYGARDEIYAGVRVFDPSTGKQLETAETNRVYGYWS